MIVDCWSEMFDLVVEMFIDYMRLRFGDGNYVI